tara:strand:+ start:92 stop:484 length:393 start_codon:yes stop_codon:yes gene_type:complete
MGILDNIKKEFKEAGENAKKKKEIADQEQIDLEKKISTIKVTTGDIKKNYEIECVVFNIGASSGMLGFIGPSPDAAFRNAEAQLKIQAANLNCNAVIHTQFEHRITVSKGVIGNNQGIEVFAYGTAVKFT